MVMPFFAILRKKETERDFMQKDDFIKLKLKFAQTDLNGKIVETNRILALDS